MSNKPIHVTEAELAVLRVLWRRQPATVRQLTDTLYPNGDMAHYATVQKLLERLRAKDCVARTKEGRAHLFTAAVDRGRLISDRLRQVADQLCDGAMAPLLSHLVSSSELSKVDIQTLRELVDRLSEQTRDD